MSTIYKHIPAKCGCEGCIYEHITCPIQESGDNYKEWPCVIDNYIVVTEEE